MISSRTSTPEVLTDTPESQSRTIIDAIPTPAWSAGPDGAVDFFNRRWLDYAGLSAQEAQGWGWVSAIHPDDRSRCLQYWRSILETGEPGEIEIRMRGRDRQYRWFLIHCSPLRDELGKIVKWYGTNTDIDARMRAEEALRASERSIRLIVDSIPGLISTRRPDGTVEFANRQVIDFFGPEAEGLTDFTPYVHPDDRERVLNDRRRAIETGQPLEHEFRARRADGEYRRFNSRNHPSRDAQGRVVRWYNLVTDIEDRKNMEEALRSSERDLGLMIERMPALAWSASTDGRVNYLNQRMLDYIGPYSPDELTERWWALLIHPHDRDSAVESWMHSVATCQPWELQCRVRKADGSYRWFHIVGQLGRDDQGRPTRWYGLLFDIDDRKNVEEALRNTQARLSRAAQVATVAELSASIAHEVNQPLAAVVANGHACHSWLSANPPNVERALLTADRVVRDGNAAAAVIQRIRALFRQAPPVKDRLAMNEVIQEVCSLIRDEAQGKCVMLDTELQSNLPTTLADRVQMQQVIANLARNAIEAMETVMDRPRELLISSRQDGDTIVIDVADRGVGITDTEAVFEPFVTTKQGGMGMGLAICRSIVEAHGGRLWATNRSPCGTVFSLAIPMFARDLR